MIPGAVYPAPPLEGKPRASGDDPTGRARTDVEVT